jgi:NAD(P)-dependent dehydrogenase (short-subunit alcohol dehydrogenase family)
VPVLDRFRLDGKRALVTGAGRGIGEAIALAFAEAGADVALSARSEPELERVAERVRERERRAAVIPADIGRIEEIEPMVDRAAAALGGLDVLANAAGNQRRRPLLDVTFEDWNFVMDVQLRGAFFVAQAAARAMRAQGRGKIIHVASMTSYRGFLDIGLYGMAKTAVVGMVRYQALEWASDNIQVNAIAPGWIETPMTATMQPDRRRWVCEHVPQGTYGQPDDVANLAVYLASGASDYCTGQTLPVDGGFLAGNPWPRLTG